MGLYEQPFRRDLSRVWEPAIWVTAPRPGEKVKSPLVVKGSARVLEATVNLRLVQEEGNKVLVETFTTATDAAPGRGDFEATLEFAPQAEGKGSLEVFWISPKDGSGQDKVIIPVVLEP